MDWVIKRMRQIEKANVLKRGDPANPRKNKKNEERVALTFLFRKAFPNVSKKIKKHWSILNINMYLSKSLESKPITSFTRKKT